MKKTPNKRSYSKAQKAASREELRNELARRYYADYVQYVHMGRWKRVRMKIGPKSYRKGQEVRQMERKSDKVRRLVADGDFKGALRIAKDFRLGITKEQSSTMTRAYECMVHGRFYKQLGYDLDEKIAEGVKILVGLYGRSEAHDLHQPVQ
jgi:chromosome condensin MukBEF MukE localization factor